MELATRNVKLRSFSDTDKTQLANLCNNKKICDNLRDFIPFPYTEQNAIEFIQFCQSENPQLTFAIEFDGVFAGIIGLVKQSDIHRITAEIGYWIGEPFWNNGIATIAVGLITNYGFESLNLQRIHTGVFEQNTGSMRVLEKNGYTKDGIFEKSVIKNGIIMNEHRFSKVK